jgi:type IV pilus assembly protein PilA
MKNNQSGFSLVELLVVVIIIAIIAAIAIPNLLSSRKAANDASAVSSMRTIHSSELTFYATSPTNVYSDLAGLGTAGLIDNVLSAGTKSGYGFAANVNTTGNATYCATAVASTGNGVNNYEVTTNGVIYKGTAIVAGDCAAGVLTLATGAVPIGN